MAARKLRGCRTFSKEQKLQIHILTLILVFLVPPTTILIMTGCEVAYIVACKDIWKVANGKLMPEKVIISDVVPCGAHKGAVENNIAHR